MLKSILIVEDEPAIADNVSYALSTEGFETIHTMTAGEAIVRVQQCPEIVLAILDIGLPDKSGFELAKSILAERSDLPLIFLTARGDEIDRVLGLELGADDYMIKPFSPRELTARVKAVLRRVERAETTRKPSSRNHSDFEIDDERFVISLRGRPLELSRYEFRLLKIFVRTPGRVFSREQLMNLAWESPEMSLERTVDTHVKTIRQKLNEIAPEVSYIVTHRGIGYSLQEE